jgi:hypothetical protein
MTMAEPEPRRRGALKRKYVAESTFCGGGFNGAVIALGGRSNPTRDSTFV